MFKRCQEMVNAARSVMEVSGQFNHEAEGLVRVSVPKAVGRFVVHPHMPEFLRRYPKVDVQLILEDRQVDMIDDNVDLSIRITDSPPPGLVGRQLLPIEHLLCATPQYLAEHGTPSHPMICWNTVASIWEKRRGFPLEISPGRQGCDGLSARAVCGEPHRCAAGCGVAACGDWQLAVLYGAACIGGGAVGAGVAGVGLYCVLPWRGVVAAFTHAVFAAEVAGVYRLSGGVYGARTDTAWGERACGIVARPALGFEAALEQATEI